MQEFHYCLFASIHTEPLEDAEANEKNYYSNCIQTSNPTTCHPRTMLQMSSEEKTNQNCSTVNAVDCHFCACCCDKNIAMQVKKWAS